MRTVLFFALTLSLSLPSLAAAQFDPVPVRSRVSLTAFTGVRVPYTTGFVSLVDAEGEPLYSVTEQRGGNALLGLDAEVRVAGPVSLLVGGIYSQTGISSFFLDRGAGFRDTADLRVSFSDETLFARAGASVRFQSAERTDGARPGPSTDLFAAAGLVRQLRTNHPALNLGFRGAFPVNRRGVEFTVGVEDYFVFWDQEALAPVMYDVLDPGAQTSGIQFLYQTSNVLLLRAGFSLRF